MQVACDETTTDEHVAAVAAALACPADEIALPDGDGGDDLAPCPAGLRRTSDVPDPPGVLAAYRSETAMLRYLRRLSDYDIALDRSMIPLGSCTMKLNAAAEMEPISWPEFAGLHPFAPAEQARRLPRADRRAWRTRWSRSPATTRCRCSRTRARRASWPACWRSAHYHRSRSEPERTVCLIPESAHGTNAACAVLAGLQVVVVKCGSDGAIDLQRPARPSWTRTRARSRRSC